MPWPVIGRRFRPLLAWPTGGRASGGRRPGWPRGRPPAARVCAIARSSALPCWEAAKEGRLWLWAAWGGFSGPGQGGCGMARSGDGTEAVAKAQIANLLNGRTLPVTRGFKKWWVGMDSNHRRYNQQIYSLPHLATLEPTRRSVGEPCSIGGPERLASGGGRFFRRAEVGGQGTRGRRQEEGDRRRGLGLTDRRCLQGQGPDRSQPGAERERRPRVRYPHQGQG